MPFPKRHLRALITALVPLVPSAPASASETRSFVVSWFHMAEYYDPEGADCPHGTNPGPEVFFRRELVRLGRPADEIDAYIANFSDLSRGLPREPVQMRGRVNGELADA